MNSVKTPLYAKNMACAIGCKALMHRALLAMINQSVNQPQIDLESH